MKQCDILSHRTASLNHDSWCDIGIDNLVWKLSSTQYLQQNAMRRMRWIRNSFLHRRPQEIVASSAVCPIKSVMAPCGVLVQRLRLKQTLIFELLNPLSSLLAQFSAYNTLKEMGNTKAKPQRECHRRFVIRPCIVRASAFCNLRLRSWHIVWGFCTWFSPSIWRMMQRVYSYRRDIKLFIFFWVRRGLSSLMSKTEV